MLVPTDSDLRNNPALALTPGRKYFVRVLAVNSVGPSVATNATAGCALSLTSCEAAVIPRALPAAPSVVVGRGSLAITDSSAEVAFGVDQNDDDVTGGSPVTRFMIEWDTSADFNSGNEGRPLSYRSSAARLAESDVGVFGPGIPESMGSSPEVAALRVQVLRLASTPASGQFLDAGSMFAIRYGHLDSNTSVVSGCALAKDVGEVDVETAIEALIAAAEEDDTGASVRVVRSRAASGGNGFDWRVTFAAPATPRGLLSIDTSVCAAADKPVCGGSDACVAALSWGEAPRMNISGLAAGVPLFVRARARSAAGYGPAGAPVVVRPTAPTTGPEDVTLDVTTGELAGHALDVAWNAPRQTNGDDVDRFRVETATASFASATAPV